MLNELQLHSRKIGGSDASVIMGVNPWKSRYQLWLEKTGQVEPEDISDKPAVEMGNLMEPLIVDFYRKKTGHKVDYTPDAPSMTHPEYDFITGMPDGFVKTATDRGILECKNVGWRSIFAWERGVPEHYKYQAYHYLLLTGRGWCDFAACLGGGEIVIIPVTMPQGMAEEMIGEYTKFWDCVTTFKPPEIQTPGEATLRWPEDNGTSVIADENITILSGNISRLKSEKKEIEKTLEKNITEIQSFMGENQSLISRGGKRLHTWKTQSRETLDTKLLKKDHPELARDYTRATTSRVFR